MISFNLMGWFGKAAEPSYLATRVFLSYLDYKIKCAGLSTFNKHIYFTIRAGGHTYVADEECSY